MCQSHVILSPSLFRWGRSRRRSTTENKRTFCVKRLLTAEIAYRRDNTRRPTVPTQGSAGNATLTDTEPVTTFVRLFQKRTTTPMSTTPAPSSPRPRTPRTRHTSSKQAKQDPYHRLHNQTAQEERWIGQSTDAPSGKRPQPTTPEPRPLHP